ncbi:MAG: phage virion morphogenesis protein [Bacteroidales bacterium]|nr:phage virion morphogenesis protein [Bacteroidales bacterium]
MNSVKKRWQLMMKDIGVDLADEFDQNFERKAFFNKKWKDRKVGNRGTLLVATGRLRRSITMKATEKSITFTSDTPYASIHNEGGEIEVTKKMKGYFWYMYGQTGYEPYKAMAMKRVGSKITIPQRQFIGYHKTIDKIVEENARAMIEDLINKTIRQ